MSAVASDASEFDTGLLTRDGRLRIVLRELETYTGPFGGWDGYGYWVLTPATKEVEDEIERAGYDHLIAKYGKFVGACIWAGLKLRFPQRDFE